MLQVGGKGLTDAVVAEVASALEHHELIKVKVAATDREARDALTEELAARAAAVPVSRIGQVPIMYRPSEEPSGSGPPRQEERGAGEAGGRARRRRGAREDKKRTK